MNGEEKIIEVSSLSKNFNDILAVDNLHLNVIPGSKKFEKCAELISVHERPAIIYTSSRRKAEEISEYL